MLEFIPIKHGGGTIVDSSPHQKFEKPDNCILECVQNAIDAALEVNGKSATTILKFHFSLVKKSDCKFFDNNFENHLKQRKHNKRQNLEESIPCLIMEDYSTTGITGDPKIVDDQTKTGKQNNWFYFLIDFGSKDSKLGDYQKGGSEGEGRQTFMLNSGIATFFGLSVDSTNQNRPSIFGMSYFGSRKVNNVRYPVFSSFGEKITTDEGVTECVPVTDAEKAQEFISLFKLKRKLSESGTSIVVPFYKREEIDKDFIIQKLVDIYRVPIFRNQLEVFVDDILINSKNIRSLANQAEENHSKKRLCDDYYEFLKQANEKINDENSYKIKFYDQDELAKKDISNFENLVQKFNSYEIIKLRIGFEIRRLQEDTQIRTDNYHSHYDIYLKKYPSALDNMREVYNDFIRGSMPVYARRNKRTSMFHLVDIQDKHAALLFKHAEQTNHSEISADNWKLKEDYKNYRKIITVSRNITTKIYNLITLEDVDEDFETTQDLFKIEEKGKGAEEGGGGEDEEEEPQEDQKITHIVVPPIFPGLKKYEVSQNNEDDGTVTYKIKGVDYKEKDIKAAIEEAEKYIKTTSKVDFSKYTTPFGRKQLDLMQKTTSTFKRRLVEYKNFLTDKCTFYPRKIIVEAAFDSEGLRNPFKRYSVRDFDFNDEDFKLELDGGIKVKEKKENQIILLANKSKFKFSVNGFGEGIEDIRWRDRNYIV